MHLFALCSLTLALAGVWVHAPPSPLRRPIPRGPAAHSGLGVGRGGDGPAAALDEASPRKAVRLSALRPQLPGLVGPRAQFPPAAVPAPGGARLCRRTLTAHGPRRLA